MTRFGDGGESVERARRPRVVMREVVSSTGKERGGLCILGFPLWGERSRYMEEQIRRLIYELLFLESSTIISWILISDVDPV